MIINSVFNIYYFIYFYIFFPILLLLKSCFEHGTPLLCFLWAPAQVVLHSAQAFDSKYCPAAGPWPACIQLFYCCIYSIRSHLLLPITIKFQNFFPSPCIKYVCMYTRVGGSSHGNYFIPHTFKWWYHKIRMCAS